mgnify:CR=1 FL=1
MQYLTEIIWLITWPVLIWISYKLSIFAVNKLEEKES